MEHHHGHSMAIPHPHGLGHMDQAGIDNDLSAGLADGHALPHLGDASGAAVAAAAALDLDDDEDNDGLVREVQQLRDALGEKTDASKAENLKRVHEANLKYQQYLRSQIQKIEILLGRNSEKKRLIQQFMAQKQHISKKPPLQRKTVFGYPWFVDKEGKSPPDNIDTIRKAKLRGTMPVVHKFVKWSKDEVNALRKGIQYQNQSLLMKQNYENYKRAKDEGKDELTARKHMQEENDRIAALQEEELLLNTNGIDWDNIARSYVRTRTGIDCMIRWMGNDDPRINNTPWTREEDKKLLQLADDYQQRNWVEIAQRLGTNRTAMQCFSRFQRSLNSSLIKSRWTQEEDEKLKHLVMMYGEKNWQQVANEMDGRTDQQCLHRWTKSINPAIRSGRWTQDEDARLRLAVLAYGKKNWSLIQRHIPGRTDVKCRERWVNVSDPSVSRKKWSQAEDDLLMKLTEEMGTGKWTEIARKLPPRTDNQCWRRWKKLSDKDQLAKYKQTLSIKKSMVRNFVGRTKERSKLEVSDVQDLSSVQQHIAVSQPMQIPVSVNVGAAGYLVAPIELKAQPQAQNPQAGGAGQAGNTVVNGPPGIPMPPGRMMVSHIPHHGVHPHHIVAMHPHHHLHPHEVDMEMMHPLGMPGMVGVVPVGMQLGMAPAMMESGGDQSDEQSEEDEDGEEEEEEAEPEEIPEEPVGGRGKRKRAEKPAAAGKKKKKGGR